MSDHNSRRIRPDEAAVVTWMLTHASVVDRPLAGLLPSVDALDVSDRCRCGCCSLQFSTQVVGMRCAPLANAVSRTASGALVDVYVWGTKDAVTALEIIGAGPSASGLPAVETLQPRDAEQGVTLSR